MPLARSDVERMLTGKLDMALDEGRDHRFYRLYVNNAFVLKTKVSTGTKYKTLGDDLVKAMAKQLRVNMSYFGELTACSKSQSDYLQYLKDQKVI